MYKQKCMGSKGPLMPTILVLSCALILFSLTDAFVRVFHLSMWAFALWLAVMLFLAALVWRYTRVQIDYVWFGGELVIRRSDRVEEYRLVVKEEDMIGLRDRFSAVGECAWSGLARNCCATLRGRTLDSCTLSYHNLQGDIMRLRFQPTRELHDMIADKIEHTKKA